MKVTEILEQLDNRGRYPGEAATNGLTIHTRVENIMNQSKKLLNLYRPYLVRGEIKNLVQIYKIASNEFKNPTDLDYATILVTSNEFRPYVKRLASKMKEAIKNPSPEEFKLASISNHKVFGGWPIEDIKYDLNSIARTRPDLSDAVNNLIQDVEVYNQNKRLRGEVTFNTDYSDNIDDAVTRRYNNSRVRNKKGKLTNPKRKKITISTNYAIEIAANQHYTCALSGIPMTAVQGPDQLSIDRISSKHGYHRGNVQFLLGRVNMMKGNLSENKFLDWCLQIYNSNSNIPVNNSDLDAALARPILSTNNTTSNTDP
jgi:hypothetical protein